MQTTWKWGGEYGEAISFTYSVHVPRIREASGRKLQISGKEIEFKETKNQLAELITVVIKMPSWGNVQKFIST